MKATSLFFALLLSASLASAQTIRYVDNNPGRTANTAAFRYTTLQAAHDAAVPNDIIYVVGSPNSYPSATLTKPLTIIGVGYQLTNNPNLQASPHSAQVSSLSFNTGSAGSLVQGLDGSSISINTNNITVRRCQLSSISTASSLSNITIRQNFLFSGISTGSNCNNITITNNFCGGSVSVSSANTNVEISNNTIRSIFMSGGGATISIFNNIFTNTSGTTAGLNDGAAFSNNIIQGGTITASGTVSGTNNIAQTGVVYPPSITGTNTNVTNAVLFITSSPSTSIDNNWRLAASGSPASGAGIGGVDIGMFGGPVPANRYVLSGIPPVPAVYFFNAPASGTTSLPNVQVQIRSNN